MCYPYIIRWVCLFTVGNGRAVNEAPSGAQPIAPSTMPTVTAMRESRDDNNSTVIEIPILETFDTDDELDDLVLSQMSLPEFYTAGEHSSRSNSQLEPVESVSPSPAATEAPPPKPCVSTWDDSSMLRQLHEKTENFINSKKNQNTESAIRSSVTKFQDFVITKGFNCDILSLSVLQMDQLLASWVLEMKKTDGSDYEPCTITAFVNRLARYISDNKKGLDGSGLNIHDANKFQILAKVVSSKKKELKEMGKGNAPNKADVLEQEDEVKLWESGALGCKNAESLVHTVWYHTTKLLGFRGCHESRQLKWGDFSVVMNDSNDSVQYISWNERETKTRHGDENQGSRAFTPKMWPDTQNQEKCPIVAFMKYESQRPTEMLNADSPFFLGINYMHGKSGKWYKSVPMGKNNIGGIMKKIAKKGNLKGKFTNHSLRRTCCTTLVRSGISLAVIAQLTGHRNLSSLLRYTTASKGQQKEMCEILQGKRPSEKNDTQSVPQKLMRPLNSSQPQPSTSTGPEPELSAAQLIPVPGNSSANQLTAVSPCIEPLGNVSLNLLHQMQISNGTYLPSGQFFGATIGSIGTININITK